MTIEQIENSIQEFNTITGYLPSNNDIKEYLKTYINLTSKDFQVINQYLLTRGLNKKSLIYPNHYCRYKEELLNKETNVFEIDIYVNKKLMIYDNIQNKVVIIKNIFDCINQDSKLTWIEKQLELERILGYKDKLNSPINLNPDYDNIFMELMELMKLIKK